MKTKFILVVLFSILYIGCQAQLFTGGNISLSTSGGSVKNGAATTDKTSNFNFGLSPRAGKFLNEKIAAGIKLNISYTRTKTPGNQDVISATSGFGFAPFVRYYAARFSKFSLFGEGSAGLGLASSSTKAGGITTDGPNTTRLNLSVLPGLAYDLSDMLSLETSLNFLSLGYTNTRNVAGNTKDITSTFQAGAGLDGIVTLGIITVGAIYKF